MEMKELKHLISTARFSIKDSPFTYREITHYDSKQLLPSKRDSALSWRKFSALDLIWLSIIKSLREYGYPLPKVLELKKKVYSERTSDVSSLLGKSALRVLGENIEMYLLIKEDSRIVFSEFVEIDITTLVLPLKQFILNTMEKIKVEDG